MATKTNNLGLSKAELTDAVRSTLTANNGNFDIIDDQIARLKANQIVGTASGTEIVVEDSAEMESILKISGNSEQDSRSGKNLFDEVSLLGDYLANGYYNFSVANLRDVVKPKVKAIDGFKTETQYTISFTGYFTTGVWAKFTFYYTDGTSKLKTFNENVEANYIFTSDVGKTVDYIELEAIYWADGKNIFIKENTLQLEEGTEATPYEPYGVQPSPDYPSEIRSVKSKSDNLFDKSIAPIYKGDADIETVELDTGVRITTGGQASSSFYGAVVYLIKDVTNDVGKTVRLKANMSPSNSGLNPLYNLILCDSNGGNRKSISAEIKESGIVSEGVIPTLTGTQTYLGVRLYSTAGGTSGTETDYTDFTNIMITIDSEIKNYQPYGYVPVEAKVEGKNLFDKNSLSATGLYLNSSGNDDASANYAISDYIEVEPNTKYTAWGTTSTGTNPSLHFYDENKTYISAVKHSSKNPITYTTPTNCKYIRESVYLPEIDLFMIEKGDIATSYEPYKTKTLSLPLGDIELRSTPDGTRDTFERVDGVWNKVEKIMPFTITEDMVASVNLEYYGIPIGAVTRPTGAIVTYKTDICLMTSYKQRMSGGENKNGLFYTGGSNTKIQFFNESITDLATAKAILTGETGIIKLDTPTYTPITDETLIQALDELEQLILYKGYNRITVTGVNGVKAYLDLSYTKDINAVLDNINAIILTLGGGANV